MKKKIFGLIVVLLLVVLVIGCRRSYDPYMETEVKSEPAPLIVASEVESEEPKSEEPEVVDLLGALRVKENYFENRNSFALKKGGDYYVLDSQMYKFDVAKYPNIGSRVEYDGSRQLTANISNTRKLVIGPVPVLTIEKGKDKICYFSASTPASLGLHKATFYGYGTCIRMQDCLEIYNPGDEGEEFYYYYDGAHDYAVLDDKGNSVSDVYNLEQGQEYTVCWYVGTQYNERKLKAESSIYDVDIQAPTYKIEPEFTKEGYATFNLSEVEPGLYFLTNGGLVEVQ